MLVCWLIGWPFMIIGALTMWHVVKKVTIPHQKLVFENSNEHGVVALASWEEAVAFKKREAKKEFLEAALGAPSVILFVIGFILVGFSTIHRLNN